MKKLKSITATTDYKRCYENGKRLTADHFIIYLIEKQDQDLIRLGVTVTKKVGNAVQRNRIKRLVKESFRNLIKEKRYKGLDIVVVAKKGIDVKKMNLWQVKQELEKRLCEFELGR